MCMCVCVCVRTRVWSWRLLTFRLCFFACRLTHHACMLIRSWFDISSFDSKCSIFCQCVLSVIEKIVKVLGAVMMYSMWLTVICSYLKDWFSLPPVVLNHICSVITFPLSSLCFLLVAKSNAYWMSTIEIYNKERFTGSWSWCCLSNGGCRLKYLAVRCYQWLGF